jgi:hypothetical protein
LLAPIRRVRDAAKFLAGVPHVDHAITGEQIYESLYVHDVAFGRVVRAAYDRLRVGCHLSSPFPKVFQRAPQPADHIPFLCMW